MPSGSSREFGHRLGLFAAVSAAAGLVVAGVLLPVVGGLGLAAKHEISTFDSLPSDLTVPPLPQGSRILAANGQVLATFYSQNRIPVTFSQVPPVMVQALVAIEDSRFFEENGLDFKGLVRAALRNGQAGGVRQGGSTLTQEYVKNILIEAAQTPAQAAAAQADTLARKAQEARYAIALGHRLTKDQILEGYLNIVYFGDGAYGIGSASEHYFGIPVEKLDLPQAALLAGLLQDPSAYDPALHPVHARARRDIVLGRMAQLHVISAAQASQAIATKIQLHLTTPGNGCVGTSAPYFCDYVLRDLLANPAFGPTIQARSKLLDEGGLTVVTTLDPKAQRAAQGAIDAKVPWTGEFGAAEAMVEPGTGAIRAMVTNAPFGANSKKNENSVNWAADEGHGDSTGFQSGSTFKVFILAAALKQGIPLSTSIYSPASFGPGNPLTGYTGCPAEGTEFGYPQRLSNAGANEAGKFNLLTGTWASVNTFYAQLELRTGMCDPATLAAEMGVRRADGTPIRQVPSMVLGANEVSPLDMADAYATIAAHGLHCPPVAITKVTDRFGQPVALNNPPCNQVLDPGLADTVTQVLTGVLDNPIGTAYGDGLGAQPAAGKTGTVTNYDGAWFIGYTPQLSSAVWLGYPHGTHSLRNVTIGGQFYSRVFGATIPAPIWQQSMQGALAGTPVVDFAPANSKYSLGSTAAVPRVAGLSPPAAEAALTSAGFTPQLSAPAVAGTTPAVTVARTDPPAGAVVPVGSTVTIFVSNGRAPKAPPPSPSPSATPSAPPPGSPPPTPTATPKHKPH